MVLVKATEDSEKGFLPTPENKAAMEAMGKFNDELSKAGILREDAYRIVQTCAMATWTRLGTAGGRSFRENLLDDPEVARLVAPDALDAAMDPALHLRSVDRIFERVFR